MTAASAPLAPPVRSRSRAARLGRALRDGWTLTRRELAQLRRRPGELVTMLLVPGVMVLLFGYVFGSAIEVPGGGDYREYLMPGMFAMISLFGVATSAALLSKDVDEGVMDRFRSLPMARSAVPLGRAVTDVLIGALSLAIMVGIGLLVGWRAHHSPAATLAGFGLVLLLRFAATWIGILIGLCVKPQTADNIVPVVFPLTMLSNSFVPTDGMPAWLRALCDANPVSALVAACRRLFGNPGVLEQQHPVAVTLVWAAALLVVFVPLATLRFRQTGR